MSHSDENIKLDDYVTDVIYSTSKNITGRPPSDGALDAAAASFCTSPQRAVPGVTRQGSGEQIVKDCRDKEQASHKFSAEMDEEKARPPVSTFSARGDEVNYNVLRAQDSNDDTLFLQDSLHETENLSNCKSHYDIKATGSDVTLRKPRPFSSDGDLVGCGSGSASTRTYDDNFMPNDLESGKGVRRKGEAKASKQQQQNNKAQSRRPNASEPKEMLTYADDSKSFDDTDNTVLTREQQIRLKEEAFIRQTFWIRGPDVSTQGNEGDVYDPDRSIGSSARSLISSGSSRDSSRDSSADRQSRSQQSRLSRDSRGSSYDSSLSSKDPQSRGSSARGSPVKKSGPKESPARTQQSRGSQTPAIPPESPAINSPCMDDSLSREILQMGSPNKSFSSWSSGSPTKYGGCRIEQLKELSREQLECLTQSLAMRVEELCDVAVEDGDDEDAPGWVWKQRYQETLVDMEEQSRLIQTLQQEKAVLINSFHSMEYCLLSVQREMREEREKAKNTRYKLVTDMAASKTNDTIVHRAIDMMNEARMGGEKLFCQLQEQRDKVTELNLLLQRLRAFSLSLRNNMRCLRYQHVQDCHMDVTGRADPPSPCQLHNFTTQQEVMEYIEGDPLERTYEHDVPTDIQHNLAAAMAHCKQALCSDQYHQDMCLQGPECPQYQMELYL